MSKKKVELRFDFDSNTPKAGDPNQYQNLAPGNRLSQNERLRNSLRAERFEEYERTMGNIAQLIGEIDFSEMVLSEEDQTIGGAFLDVIDKIDRTNDRISAGSFPTREIFGQSVFRSFWNQTPESIAVIQSDNNMVPGTINFNPEFEIVKIYDRTITMLGGKILTGRSVINVPTLASRYSITIDPPEVIKNVDFDDSLAVYPKSARNEIELTYNMSSGRFEGNIPVQKSATGSPHNLPIEPGRIVGSEALSLDIRVLWEDNGVDRVLSENGP
ncbi:MAG: hypothetical protein DRI61_09700, partial [Chloroflexi bacterium]